MKQKTFIPQISNVEILDYPVRAGSGNIGIAADVLGERKRQTISLTEEMEWRKAKTEEKPLKAMEIAAHVFHPDLLQHFNMDHKKVQSAQELMYHLWDSMGRMTSGQEWDIMVNDRKLFPDNEETEIAFDIHDGFAVGEYEGKEYVMTYPTRHDLLLNERMKNYIKEYVGAATTKGIIPADIALTYGKITIVNELPQVLLWDADKTIHQNLQIKPDMLDEILKEAGYQNEMKLPTQKGGTVKAGFIVIGDDNKVKEFRLIPSPDCKARREAFYRNFPKDGGIRDVLNMYSDWKMRTYEKRITDVTFRQAPNNPEQWFIGCKIDGRQQVSRPMTQRDAFLYRQLQDKDSYYSMNLISGFLVNYFKDAILTDRNRQQGISM